MRIAIVDDLETERAQLKTRLARQLRLCGTEAQLLEFESGESFLAAEKEQRFTAAFLDIYMHGIREYSEHILTTPGATNRRGCGRLSPAFTKGKEQHNGAALAPTRRINLDSGHPIRFAG